MNQGLELHILQSSMECNPFISIIPFVYHSNLFSQEHLHEKRSRRNAHDLTFMLILVISFFLLTEVPLLIITTLHTISNRYFPRNFVLESIINFIVSSLFSFMDYDITRNIIILINLLVCLLNPMKLAIYCGMSR